MTNELDELLLKPWIGKDNFLKIIRAHPEYINPLLAICKTDRAPQAWRAAWLLRHVLRNNDERLGPHLAEIASVLPGKEDGHQRELLLLIDKAELNEKLCGIVFDKSSEIWQTVSKKPSTRITAFKVMIKIAKQYPELQREVNVLSSSHYSETLSPGIRKMFFRMISNEE